MRFGFCSDADWSSGHRGNICLSIGAGLTRGLLLVPYAVLAAKSANEKRRAGRINIAGSYLCLAAAHPQQAEDNQESVGRRYKGKHRAWTEIVDQD